MCYNTTKKTPEKVTDQSIPNLNEYKSWQRKKEIKVMHLLCLPD